MLPVLSSPIGDIDMVNAPISIRHHLLYHYYSGCILAAVQQFSKACSYFESVREAFLRPRRYSLTVIVPGCHSTQRSRLCHFSGCLQEAHFVFVASQWPQTGVTKVYFSTRHQRVQLVLHALCRLCLFVCFVRQSKSTRACELSSRDFCKGGPVLKSSDVGNSHSERRTVIGV